jgi:phosphoribosyl 1,2-cyclic phosphate phosphodiesterase
MRVTGLGCGPSAGVPLLGCGCAVCRSDDPRDRRRRSSIVVEKGPTRVLVDASPDLREQLLDARLTRLDAVIFTHDHADHSHGLDELRSINFHIDAPLPVFADAATLAVLRQRFAYAFTPNEPGRGWYKPWLIAHTIEGPFTIGGLEVWPFAQQHGRGTTLGLRFNGIAYSTDVNALSEDAFAALAGLEVWIVGCLRPRASPMHAGLERVREWIGRVRPRRAVLTHMGHEFSYAVLRASLPHGLEPAYDGMVIATRDDERPASAGPARGAASGAASGQ